MRGFLKTLASIGRWKWWLIGLGICLAISLFLGTCYGLFGQVAMHVALSLLPSFVPQVLSHLSSFALATSGFLTANLINIIGLIAAICSAWATYSAKKVAEKQIEVNRAWLAICGYSAEINEHGDTEIEVSVKNYGRLPSMVPCIDWVIFATPNISEENGPKNIKTEENKIGDGDGDFGMIVGPGESRTTNIIINKSLLQISGQNEYFISIRIVYLSPVAGKRTKKDKEGAQILTLKLNPPLEQGEKATLSHPSYLDKYDSISNFADRKWKTVLRNT